MNEDRAKYNQYVENINKMLKSENFYADFQKKLKVARPIIKLNRKKRAKTFDMEWVEMIEDSIISLDNIVRNPRKFIVQEEDIVDISLARAISTESVKHLAQHTNFISSVDEDGMVTPNKILNVTKEESFEVYENRFIYTLLRNLNNFISRRLDAIKAAYINDNVLELDVDTSIFTGKTRVFYKLELIGALPIDEVRELDNEDLTVVERIAKAQRIVMDFLSSAFAKQMVNSAPVRPPITRTNVILKNPDFKKALVLWQFIESYTKMGFSVENDIKQVPMDQELTTGVQDMICLGTMLMQGLIEGKTEDTAFFNESNMDEKDMEEEETENKKDVEKKEEQKEEDKEQEPEKEPEEENSEEMPQNEDKVVAQEEEQKEEEEQQEEQDEDDQEEEEEDEELDVPEDIGLLDESRDMFQRTSDEVILTKTEMSRINKAIDRVLEKVKMENAQQATAAVLDKVDDKEVLAERLLAQIEKEISMITRAKTKRTQALEREIKATEIANKKDEERLKVLEEQKEKHTKGEDMDEDVVYANTKVENE
ncbi:MAG: DUF2357 domain-containing protein [Clostridiales bacterium]|nr:DUF2357 domain-containing protein [Clostridiales bacterium]